MTSDTTEYQFVLDPDLAARSYPPIGEIADPEKQALAMMQPALRLLVGLHWGGKGTEAEAQCLGMAMQVVAAAARLPLQVQIATLEGRVAALEQRLGEAMGDGNGR